jgi:hypothetical protein
MSWIAMKGFVEALNLAAGTFEHLGKIGIAEKKRAGDLGGLVVAARYDQNLLDLLACQVRLLAQE